MKNQIIAYVSATVIMAVVIAGAGIGIHKGITHYTVGQRKGLNLSMGKPVFVVEIRPETNEVVIGDSKDVFSDHLTCDHLNWTGFMEKP